MLKAFCSDKKFTTKCILLLDYISIKTILLKTTVNFKVKNGLKFTLGFTTYFFWMHFNIKACARVALNV